jgi:hypothetical protein
MNNGELDRFFKDMGAASLKDVRRRATCSLDEFSCHIISSIPLLAAGHPCTLQLMMQDYRDGRLLPCLLDRLSMGDCTDAYQTLWQMSQLDVLRTTVDIPLTGNPEVDKPADHKRNLILSVEYCNAIRGSVYDRNALFRDMLESNDCLIFDQKAGTAPTTRPTLSLGAFFQLTSVIDHCVDLSRPVGDMCSVTHELCFRSDVTSISEAWERSRILSVVAYVNNAASKPAAWTGKVAGINGCRLFGYLSKNAVVKLHVDAKLRVKLWGKVPIHTVDGKRFWAKMLKWRITQSSSHQPSIPVLILW